MTQETFEQIINTLQEGEIPLEKLEEIDKSSINLRQHFN